MRDLAVKIIWWFVLLLALWLGGFAWFFTQIPSRSDDSSEIQADAIVVLTGGSGRLEYGMRLLAAGKGQKLFISGVSKGVTIDDILKQLPDDLQISRKRFARTIVLGDEAVNTIGNAEETARWVAQENYETIRLVTSNYHMPRSLEEFQHTMPQVAVIPDPVFAEDFSSPGWWLLAENRERVFSEYHKFLAAKLRHLLVSVSRKP